MSPRILLHLEFTPNDRQPRIRLMQPHGNFPIQYLQHTICRKNAAQQDRRNPGDPRSRPWGWSATSFNFGSATYMHKQLRQYFQSTPTCISSNIYSTAQLIMVSTSTAQLLASQDINRLFRLCVHPGPVSSHISQPLVASFDKTATAPQTEQYWQSCNSWCKIHAKAVTSIPFSKGIRSLWEYSRWRKWQRHFYLAFPTKLSYYFQYIRSCMCNLIMLVHHNLCLILHIFAHIFHHM